MQENQPQQTEKPQVELLAKLFSNFEIPRTVNIGNTNQYLLGSKNFTKMVMFAVQTQLNNDDIDFWSRQKPQRQEQEDYMSYKQRLKFTKMLDKYRPWIYDYNKLETVMGGKKYSVKRARKIKKQLGI